MAWIQRRAIRLGLGLGLALSLLAAPAAAQNDEDKPLRFREPGISYKDMRKPYIEWVAGTLIVLAVLFVTFKNPHRTHLD